MSTNWLEGMDRQMGEPGQPMATPVFAGQKLVVVGGSSGMGRQTAADVVAAGGSAVIIGQDPGKVDDTVQALAKDGPAYGITADLTDRMQVERVRQAAACWLAAAGRFAYTANAGSGNIGRYAVASEGTLTTLGRTPIENDPTSSTHEEGVSGDRNYLYVLVQGLSQIVGHRVGADGSLTQVTAVPVAVGSFGVGPKLRPPATVNHRPRDAGGAGYPASRGHVTDAGSDITDTKLLGEAWNLPIPPNRHPREYPPARCRGCRLARASGRSLSHSWPWRRSRPPQAAFTVSTNNKNICRRSPLRSSTRSTRWGSW